MKKFLYYLNWPFKKIYWLWLTAGDDTGYGPDDIIEDLYLRLQQKECMERFIVSLGGAV